MDLVTQVRSDIFRACDIRGIVPHALNEEVAFLLGRSFGTLAREKQHASVVVGRDGRHSGRILVRALCDGLIQSGCQVIDIGLVPTPLVYFATHLLQTGTGIMVTGSHNPANYNGFKMMLAGDTLAQEDIQILYRRIQAQDFSEGIGSLRTQCLIDSYVERIQQKITLARKLKIVVDCGSGAVGVLAEKLFQALGCEVIPLFCEVDGDFPFHHPDPGQPHNLQALIKMVKQEKADVGIAFDGDGDRLGVVTEKGEIVWPDRVMMLFSQEILKNLPGSKIVYDVKCSHYLGQKIHEWGGIPIMYKTGHSLIKRKMKEVGAVLGGEMSGHFFLKEGWYGFDDACFAAARLLALIAKQAVPLSSLFDHLPHSVSTPEINIPIPEERKFEFIDRLKAADYFTDAQVITIDGLRVEFPQGWGLVRASNTTPCLVLRFEAKDREALLSLQTRFKQVILTIAPELKVPF